MFKMYAKIYFAYILHMEHISYTKILAVKLECNPFDCR